jgi:quercetin dioxygenase-like cupin family protein
VLNPSDHKETQMRITNAKKMECGSIVQPECQSRGRRMMMKWKAKTLRKWAVAGLVILPVAAFATPRAGNLFIIVLNRATAADPIHTVGHVGRWHVALQTNGPSDFMVQYSGYAPGGYTGWHSHPGPVLVTVKRGTATWYEADRLDSRGGDDQKEGDPACTPHVYPTGSAFVEPQGSVHTVQNESPTEQLELVTTYIVPVGVATRQDENQPVTCPQIP